jgi:hypothetical protein
VTLDRFVVDPPAPGGDPHTAELSAEFRACTRSARHLGQSTARQSGVIGFGVSRFPHVVGSSKPFRSQWWIGSRRFT